VIARNVNYVVEYGLRDSYCLLEEIRKGEFMLKLITLALVVTALPITASATQIQDFINKRNCDQVLDKKYYKICYDYNLKAATYVGYRLDGDLVNKVNIKKRPRFYPEKRIPKQYRATSSDYTHTGWDRGHLNSDANEDMSPKSLHSVYTMANIVAMAPAVNRKTWVKAEKYERKVAYKLGEIWVINGIDYSSNPPRIGRNHIAVPSAYWKIIYNNKGFEKCFYYKNDPIRSAKGDKLRNHLIDCSKLKSRHI